MDLNYLYQRHGISLMLAQNAACEAARNAHLSLAQGYARRIAEARGPSPALAA